VTDDQRALLAAMKVHDDARKAWRGSVIIRDDVPTYEGAVLIGARWRDVNAAADDLRESRKWD
jgi:hypothetical protein